MDQDGGGHGKTRNYTEVWCAAFRPVETKDCHQLASQQFSLPLMTHSNARPCALLFRSDLPPLAISVWGARLGQSLLPPGCVF